MLNTEVIRQYFPFLSDGFSINVRNPRRMRIAVDNTASTQMSLPVLENLIACSLEYANVHRGEYKASLSTSWDFERAYNIAANLVNADSWREIIFGRNTTEMINLVMRIIQDDIRDGDNIVVTRLEHNSNYVPWYGLQQLLAKREHPVHIDIKVVDFEPETGELYMSQMESSVNSQTKLVAATGGSNFLGVRLEIKRIGEIAHQSGYSQPRGSSGSYFLVDGAQLVPCTPVDVKEIDCDFLAWSFHKMAIPLGVGGLYTKSEIIENLSPFLYGGDMIEEVAVGDVKYKECPWKYTAGTPNILGTIATGYGIVFLINLGLGNLYHESDPGKDERIDLCGRLIEIEMLMNTPKGDLEAEYEVPARFKDIWDDYLTKYPEVQTALNDPFLRLIGVRRVINTAMENIRRHEEELTQYALDSLLKIPGVSIYGPYDSTKRVGLVAFNIDGLEPDMVAKRLDNYGVEVRSGTHCACLAHRYIGIEGSVRMSFYIYNNLEDVKNAVKAVADIAKAHQNSNLPIKSRKSAIDTIEPIDRYIESEDISKIHM